MLIILKSKENLALKGRLSNAATITKQEGIALTMKSWEVKARGVSKSILKQYGKYSRAQNHNAECFTSLHRAAWSFPIPFLFNLWCGVGE